MTKKIVSQLDNAGFYLGPIEADPSPLEEGVFLIPGGAVDAPPPVVPEGKCARWNGSVFVIEDLPTEVIAAAEARNTAKAIALIEAHRDNSLASGFEFNGVVYPSDNVFQSQLGHYLLAWQVGLLGDGSTVPVRRMDNVTVQFDRTGVTALAGALLIYVQSVWATSWAEKDALRGM